VVGQSKEYIFDCNGLRDVWNIQSLVWDRVCAIGEFICDTPVLKGQNRVTMATNFWTKIVIIAFLWEIARIWLLLTAGFRGQQIQRRHFWLQGSKGRCHGNQILAKIGKNITKMPITSVVYEISREVTMTTIFWTKIAINAFLWETWECDYL